MKNLFTMVLQIIFICTFNTLAQRLWTQQNSGTTAQLYDVDFVDEYIGFAVGTNVLLKTTDSGLNWVNWSSVSGTFYDLDFLDENFGFILRPVGFPGNSTNEIWKTTDGGQNWAIQTIEIFGAQPLGISFADNLNGMIAAGYKTILLTTDGGVTWISHSLGNSPWADVYFRNTTAIAVSRGLEIAKTTDSGINWNIVTINANLGDFQAVHWSDENLITVTGDYGIVYSTDGGGNWIVSDFESEDIFGVYCVSATECTGAGLGNVIIHTTDIGITWRYDNSGTNADFQGVYFVNSERGIAVGSGGSIITTGPIPVPTFGIISGIVSMGGNGLDGITVKLLDEQGLPMVGFDEQDTDANGHYSFVDVSAGDYQVGIVEPLGYASDMNPKSTTVAANQTSTVDFYLTEFVIVNQARSKGYWKHQFDVYVRNRGNAQESEQDLIDYIDLVHQHYTLYYDIFTDVNTFPEWQAILSLKGNHPMADRAKQHLAALIMNMVSNKIGQYTVVTDDGRTVGDVIQYVSELIIDGDDNNDELAKDLAESVNNQQMIASGVVPEGNILFKVSSEVGEVLTYDLENNYPNPFNPSTLINYNIPEAGFVTLKVYDVIGKEVANLVSENKGQGSYSVTFDASDLPSGIYVYQLKVNSFIDTKKMILMK
ncbi:MAG: YCF48-related protein [Candidatus Kariarchaeaceae archaeon]